MELLARALGPALPPALASVRVAWAWARYLLVDPLVLPVAGLVDVPVQAFLAHFATLSPRNQWAVVAALGVGGGTSGSGSGARVTLGFSSTAGSGEGSGSGSATGASTGARGASTGGAAGVKSETSSI